MHNEKGATITHVKKTSQLSVNPIEFDGATLAVQVSSAMRIELLTCGMMTQRAFKICNYSSISQFLLNLPHLTHIYIFLSMSNRVTATNVVTVTHAFI